MPVSAPVPNKNNDDFTPCTLGVTPYPSIVSPPSYILWWRYGFESVVREKTDPSKDGLIGPVARTDEIVVNMLKNHVDHTIVTGPLSHIAAAAATLELTKATKDLIAGLVASEKQLCDTIKVGMPRQMTSGISSFGTPSDQELDEDSMIVLFENPKFPWAAAAGELFGKEVLADIQQFPIRTQSLVVGNVQYVEVTKKDARVAVELANRCCKMFNAGAPAPFLMTSNAHTRLKEFLLGPWSAYAGDGDFGARVRNREFTRYGLPIPNGLEISGMVECDSRSICICSCGAKHVAYCTSHSGRYEVVIVWRAWDQKWKLEINDTHARHSGVSVQYGELATPDLGFVSAESGYKLKDFLAQKLLIHRDSR